MESPVGSRFAFRDIEIGKRIFHEMYGTGTIKKTDGKLIVVEFDKKVFDRALQTEVYNMFCDLDKLREWKGD